MKFKVHLTGVSGKKTHAVELERKENGYDILIDGHRVVADAVQVSANTISILLNGQSYEIHIAPTLDGVLKLQTGLDEFLAEVEDPRAWRGRKHGAVEAEGRQQVVAPMPGKVIRVLISAGDRVVAGQGLMVVEAMKMQNEIRSPKGGRVERLLAKEGQNVNAGEVLGWVE